MVLALLVCTIFRRGGNIFSKTLRNYAVRVDMLRDLRLAGSTTKRSSLYAGTLRNVVRYHEDTAYLDFARTCIYDHIHHKC